MIDADVVVRVELESKRKRKEDIDSSYKIKNTISDPI